MQFYAQKQPSGLFRPVDDDDWDAAKKVSLGDMVKVTTHRQRDLRHHKKFFTLIQLIVEHTPERHDPNTGEVIEVTKHTVLTELKFRTGWYEEVRFLHNGEVKNAYIPKSINFASMGQEEFEDFYQKCVDIAVKHFVNMSADMLDDAVLEKVMEYC